MTGYDLAKLRADVRDVEDELEQLDRFEESWREYIQRLGQLIEPADRQRTFRNDDATRGILALAEGARLNAYPLRRSMGSYSSRYMDAFLHTNLRAEPSKLIDAISISVMAPDEIDHVNVISAERFRAAAGECAAIVRERREELQAGLRRRRATLEEAGRAIEEEHTRQMELARRNAPGLADLLRRTKVGSFLVWAFEGRLKGLVSTVILAVLGAVLLAVLGWVAPFIQGLLGFAR